MCFKKLDVQLISYPSGKNFITRASNRFIPEIISFFSNKSSVNVPFGPPNLKYDITLVRLEFLPQFLQI
jgi:hypothetical protein